MAAFTAKDKKDPQEDIKKLNGIISSGNYSNIHLLFGEEDYLRNQFRDKLIDALTGGEKSMNFDRFSGKETVPEQVIDLAETMPFFSDRRVILLEDTGWMKSGGDAFVEYIKQGICESTYIVICEREADKRSKLIKEIERVGVVSEFMSQNETTLGAWASKMIKDTGLSINGADVNYFLNRVGSDMVSISHEIEKLTTYCLGRDRVTRADIDAICSRHIEDAVFDMCDAFALRRQKVAMKMYYDQISNKDEPIKLLVLITRHYNLLLQLKDMDIRRGSDAEIAAKLKKPAWTLKNYRAQTSHYTLGELKKIVQACADTDMRIKSGLVKDDVGLETLIVRLSAKEFV